jgi:ATP-dependent Clp protease protease subunit
VENKEADIYIFGDITSWPWIESDVSSYNLAQEIAKLDVDIINVHINSYGGEVAEGWAIHNELLNHKASIKTFCSGFACSSAGLIFMAGNERFMYPASALFVHNAWSFAIGNAKELHKAADDLDKLSDISCNVFRGKINISEDELQELMDAETWINPQEALNMGFATAIITEPASTKASASVRGQVYGTIMAAQAARQAGDTKPSVQQTSSAPVLKPLPLEEEKPLPKLRLGKFIDAL